MLEILVRILACSSSKKKTEFLTISILTVFFYLRKKETNQINTIFYYFCREYCCLFFTAPSLKSVLTVFDYF